MKSGLTLALGLLLAACTATRPAPPSEVPTTTGTAASSEFAPTSSAGGAPAFAPSPSVDVHCGILSTDLCQQAITRAEGVLPTSMEGWRSVWILTDLAPFHWCPPSPSFVPDSSGVQGTCAVILRFERDDAANAFVDLSLAASDWVVAGVR